MGEDRVPGRRKLETGLCGLEEAETEVQSLTLWRKRLRAWIPGSERGLKTGTPESRKWRGTRTPGPGGERQSVLPLLGLKEAGCPLRGLDAWFPWGQRGAGGRC